MPEAEADIELLIGVYSSEDEAKSAIERAKQGKGFVGYSQGLQVCRYELNRDRWIGGFIID